jgi:F0F1-type ATP synthase epsilon subunit
MSPHEVVWQGEVALLESTNIEGVFSILPDHARFMTIIQNETITVVLPDSTTKSFTFSLAVLFFADNDAKIYTQPELTSQNV